MLQRKEASNMKSLFVAMAGLVIVLSFLVPAMLSQGATMGAPSNTGTTIQGSSQNPYALLYEGIGGGQGSAYANSQPNDAYGDLMGAALNTPGSSYAQSSGQTMPGSGGLCMDLGGNLC
jgi:hypothetical protein